MPPMQAARSALKGPDAHLGSPVAGSGLFVQVGAYGSQSEAERQLAHVRERSGAFLQGRTALTIAGIASGRTFYRARFGGFDVQSANQACTELRRRQIDCFVTKAE